MENRNILIGLGTGLVAGFLLGYGTGVYFTTTSGHNHPPAPPAAAAPPAGMPPMGMGQVDAFARIAATKSALEKNPKDFDALVLLGNDYFDTHQPQLSVDAYAKALALDPKNPKAPDILTDQGVMYRELKAYDKALANFKQAGKLDPNHLPSMLNMGIVYATNLNDKAAARKIWAKIVEIAPESPQGQQAKQFLTGI
ncbi:tetratricopeptide repeat protein [Geothrix sp. 21YS21S-2]|uniref:tetratricopeptide repeat protein n=1 Tax=Geothrix sp. 21YS21S-2 TaxID=3068893 RepID=UPI0027B88FD4|nr:tetratricopeptide repeat protein [Geothrix sp. 21YS21S-2]